MLWRINFCRLSRGGIIYTLKLGCYRAKHYNSELKQEVAELVFYKNYSVRKAAVAMNVGKSTVNRWARSLRKERTSHEITAHLISAEQRKIKALELEIQRLKMEKDILKKPTALLMSDSMSISC